MDPSVPGTDHAASTPPAASGPADVGFSTLFDFLPIGAYRSTPDGRMLRANAALVRLNGYDTEAALLDAVGDIATEWYVDTGRRDDFRQRLERRGVVLGFVSEVHRHRTRERCWISENAHVVRDGEGRTLYYEGTVEDITQRMQAQQALARSEAQFRQIANQMPGMVYRIQIGPDGQRRYLFVSDGVRQLYGLAPEALMADASLLSRFRHPDDRHRLEAAVKDSIAKGQRGGALFDEFRIVLDDGTEKWVHMASNTVDGSDGGVLRVGVMVDITERKQAEALRLERDRAELASQAKSQLLSRVSHELRTPLNAVLGFSQLMATDPRAAPTHRDWALQIVASGRHLLGLVEDVLDLSSMHTGQLSLGLDTVALAPLVAETWRMVATGMPQPAVDFVDHAQAALQVRADPMRLKQVLANLLSNAVKYNRAGGQVAVSTRVEAGTVVLEVSDTGCGMDASQLARLFHPFDRLGAEHSRVEGRGLGLALSLQLVEAMGGDISVASAPGDGTTFTVRLPRAGAEGAAGPAPAVVSPAAPR